MARSRRDQLCDRIIARQLGVVAAGQAIAAGHTRRTIGLKIRDGEWTRVHSGIYASAASPNSWERRAIAAQLLAGPKGALSHLTSAYLFRLTDRRPGLIDLTTSRCVKGRGVRVHRSVLSGSEMIRRAPFVNTAPARTLIDISALLPIDELEDCVEEALHRRLLDMDLLRSSLDAIGTRGRRGAGRLRELLESRDPHLRPTATRFESLLHRVLRLAGLPLPIRQLPVFDDTGFITRLDFAYTQEKIGLPADSYEWHARRRPWERDIDQRNRLLRLGWRLRPTTWTELKRRPECFTSDVAVLLGWRG